MNVALNFISSLYNLPNQHSFVFAVARNSEIHKYLKKKGEKNMLVLPRHPVSRILYELFIGWIYLKISRVDIMYTYFGFSLFLTDIPQVTGSADSNLFYPDIEFWSDYKGINRIRKHVIDCYRIFGLKRSYAVIFENQILMERAIKMYGIKRATLIKPSFVNFDSRKDLGIPSDKDIGLGKGLFLCGWQMHKNVMMIPHIAHELRLKSIHFQFILTAPLNDCKMHREFIKLSCRLNVSHMIKVIGPVIKEDLSSLYSQIDFVFLLSKLESFSNNIIEAWFFGKPLLVSDAEWSRSICGSAAYYVNRESPLDIANAIEELAGCSSKRDDLIARGRFALAKYPSPNQKTQQEIDYLFKCLSMRE